MRVHLHIGVHKTATTYIQSVLEANRPALSAAGIGYLPLRPMRDLISRKLDRLSPETFRLEDMLEHFFAGKVPANIRGIIISEENLLGNNAETVQSGHLYPRALPRLSHVRALLAGHEVTAFMSIRSYDDYIASQYCEAMRWQTFCRFETFRQRMDFPSFRWPRLYAGVMAALAPHDIRIWRYEDFRANAELVIRALAFDFGGPLALDQPDMKAGISQAAMDRLHAIEKEMGAKAATDRVRNIEAEFPKTAGVPAFDPWAEKERAQLRKAYAEDCNSAPDKWLVKPGAASRD